MIPRASTRRALLLAGVLPLLAAATAGPRPVAAQDCRKVSYLSSILAAPQSNVLNQGQDIPIPLDYAKAEQETNPAVTNAEAGPLSLGLLEGFTVQPKDIAALAMGFLPIPLPDGFLAPPDLPEPLVIPTVPGRAVASYPVESIPDTSEGTWGAGRSSAKVTPTSSAAHTTAFDTMGALSVEVGADARSTRTCERLELHAAWSADVLLSPTVPIIQLGQTIDATMDRDSIPVVKVQTTIVRSELPLGGLFGQLPDDGIAELFKSMGQSFELNDPVVRASKGKLEVQVDPLVLSFKNPSGPQTIGTGLGHIEMNAEYLGILPDLDSVGDIEGPTLPVEGGSPPFAGPAAGGGGGDTDLVTPGSAAAEPSITRTSRVIDVLKERSDWSWLFQTLALGGLLGAWLLVASARGEKWPTAAWTFRQIDRGTERFRAAFLRW